MKGSTIGALRDYSQWEADVMDLRVGDQIRALAYLGDSWQSVDAAITALEPGRPVRHYVEYGHFRLTKHHPVLIWKREDATCNPRVAKNWRFAHELFHIKSFRRRQPTRLISLEVKEP